MGLFRRKKDEGFTDVGGGMVALSAEQQDELADEMFNWVLERYEDEVPPGIEHAVHLALFERHGPELTEELDEVLASLARMGYVFRRFEDEMESIEAAVPWLSSEILGRWETSDDIEPPAILADIVLELCDHNPDEPDAPRSISAIDSDLAPLRSQVCRKSVVAVSITAAKRGMCQPGELPEGTDPSEMLAVWRIGFLMRACQMSVPEALTGDSDGS